MFYCNEHVTIKYNNKLCFRKICTEKKVVKEITMVFLIMKEKVYNREWFYRLMQLCETIFIKYNYCIVLLYSKLFRYKDMKFSIIFQIDIYDYAIANQKELQN